MRLGSAMAVRMISLTGGAFTPEAVAFLERVDRPHLDKPFKVADLRKIIADLVH